MSELDRILNHRMTADRIDIGIITGEPQKALCGAMFVPHVQVGSSGRASVKGAPDCPTCEGIMDGWRQMKKLEDMMLRDLRVTVQHSPEVDAARGLLGRSRAVQEILQ